MSSAAAAEKLCSKYNINTKFFLSGFGAEIIPSDIETCLNFGKLGGIETHCKSNERFIQLHEGGWGMCVGYCLPGDKEVKRDVTISYAGIKDVSITLPVCSPTVVFGAVLNAKTLSAKVKTTFIWIVLVCLAIILVTVVVIKGKK
jgi:hypothetical protein